MLGTGRKGGFFFFFNGKQAGKRTNFEVLKGPLKGLKTGGKGGKKFHIEVGISKNQAEKEWNFQVVRQKFLARGEKIPNFS